MYINGNLAGQRTAFSNNVTFCSNATLIVGGWYNGISGGASALQNLRGSLDELRFYNRTLTAKQIAWLSRNFQTTSVRQSPTLRSGIGSRLR